jgi:hypothetical protein
MTSDEVYQLGRVWLGLSGDRRAWVEARAADKYGKLRAWLYDHSSSARQEIDHLTRLAVLRQPATRKRLKEWVIKPLKPEAAIAAARGQANVLKILPGKGWLR